MLVLGREYVAEADATIIARDDIMCTTDCPCKVDNFDAWEDVDSTTKNAWESNSNGVTNWSDCAAKLDTTQSGV
jgi:hypothetical protein